MTRSVEIPEEAVEAACEASEGYWGPSIPAATRAMVRDRNRRVIEAALPYLVPAEETPCNCGFGGFHDDVNPRCERNQEAAPAGDGGVREALEALIEEWRWQGDLTPWQEGGGPDAYSGGLDDAAARLRATLAAHPAAPAVPQPVDRDHEPGTRFVVVEIPPAASDEEADEITEKVFNAAADIDAQYTGPWDLFIYRQHNAPPANVPAASPQPVDREALAICLHSFDGYAIETGEQWSECNQDRKGVFLYQADAVLAVLAGEQEQVEK